MSLLVCPFLVPNADMLAYTVCKPESPFMKGWNLDLQKSADSLVAHIDMDSKLKKKFLTYFIHIYRQNEQNNAIPYERMIKKRKLLNFSFFENYFLNHS